MDWRMAPDDNMAHELIRQRIVQLHREAADERLAREARSVARAAQGTLRIRLGHALESFGHALESFGAAVAGEPH
jgi:hypothetical protein